ncbi:hypothetical protein CTI12_AA627900 [Artemisia annua]|uniref:Uncharacterized protein n=1 Tax=Artemisia annua TaxID=35608 RepID=A0A2U1K9S3_ARTAN|nr:hypothetical protein CTI12_AA627900 [Artemisia annua]
MPPDPPKPPDTILEELCTLTGMKAEGLNHKPIVPSDVNRPPKPCGRPKGAKNRFRNVMVKAQSLGSASAGAGAILKRLRSSKVEGKGRSRGVASSMEDKCVNRSNVCNAPVDVTLSKVLNRIKYDKSISDQVVFKECISDKVKNYCLNPVSKGYCSINGNDVSFINKPIESIPSDVNGISVSMEYKEDGVDGVVDPCLVSNNTVKCKVAGAEHFGTKGIRKTNEDELNDGKNESAFVFGKVQSNKGILKKPPIGLISVQFGPSLFYKAGHAWSSFTSGVKAMRSDVEDRELQMNFAPQCVSKSSDGSRRVAITVEDIKKGSEACALQLYGYFVGTSMDYRVVNANLSKMWRAYGISDITKTNAGLFYFKFKNEEGMKIPLVLNTWEPGTWLEKVEPSTIPIWVCIYGVPMELCNGNGIGKIFSGVGRPMLMDKLTKERCLKKAGKLDFARVLVEVSANEDLPNFIEIEYPQLGDRPARVGKLEIKYQWKPPLCTHCNTFDHSIVSCKSRPRTEEEIAAGY